jgi:hypothetical protein
LHAGLTADASLAVEIDDAVGSAEKRDGRADLDAGGVIAVIAAQNAEMPPHIRIAAFLNVLNPRAIYSDRNVVLFFASDGAGVTADAAVVIYEKAVAHPLFTIAVSSERPQINNARGPYNEFVILI